MAAIARWLGLGSNQARKETPSPPASRMNSPAAAPAVATTAATAPSTASVRQQFQDLVADDLELLLALAISEHHAAAEAARKAVKPPTLTVEQFEGLPVPDPNGAWRREQVECSVCLEDLSTGPLRALPSCGHVFHESCLREWVTEKRATCPLDNADILCTCTQDGQRSSSSA